MAYGLSFDSRAMRAFEKLPREIYFRAKTATLGLAENPRPPGCLRLKGKAEWRIRIGKYRIIYLIDDTLELVTITDVGQRSDIYRK